MTAIFWLIGITLSIYLAFYIPFRLFKRFNSSFMIGNAVAGFWQKAREYMPEDSDNETIPDLCCPKCHQQDLQVLLGILWD